LVPLAENVPLPDDPPDQLIVPTKQLSVSLPELIAPQLTVPTLVPRMKTLTVTMVSDPL